MTNYEIISRVNQYLFKATKILVELLENTLPKISEDWWNRYVINNLTDEQRKQALKNGYKKIDDFDLLSLLKIASDIDTWNQIQKIDNSCEDYEINILNQMRHVRNNWAHCKVTLPPKDTILKDLKTLYNFFENRNYNKILPDILSMIKEIKYSPIENSTLSSQFNNINKDQFEPKIEKVENVEVIQPTIVEPTKSTNNLDKQFILTILKWAAIIFGLVIAVVAVLTIINWLIGGVVAIIKWIIPVVVLAGICVAIFGILESRS